jgi:ABC-type iron transport system FetAB ATPase subunit
MAKDNIIQFPSKKEHSKKQKARVLQLRLDEIEVENNYITEDIAYLKGSLEKMSLEMTLSLFPTLIYLTK